MALLKRRERQKEEMEALKKKIEEVPSRNVVDVNRCFGIPYFQRFDIKLQNRLYEFVYQSYCNMKASRHKKRTLEPLMNMLCGYLTLLAQLFLGRSDPRLRNTNFYFSFLKREPFYFIIVYLILHITEYNTTTNKLKIMARNDKKPEGFWNVSSLKIRLRGENSNVSKTCMNSTSHSLITQKKKRTLYSHTNNKKHHS